VEVVTDLAVPVAMLVGLRVSAAASLGTELSSHDTSVEEAAL